MATNLSPNNNNTSGKNQLLKIGGSILSGFIALLAVFAHLSDMGSFILSLCQNKIIFCHSSPPDREQNTSHVIENQKISNTQQEKPPRFIKSPPPKTSGTETKIRFIRAKPKPTFNSR